MLTIDSKNYFMLFLAQNFDMKYNLKKIVFIKNN